MVKTAAFAATLAISASAAAAANCNETISNEIVSLVSNGSYYNTCVEGASWNLTDAFGAWNLSEPDLTKLCLSAMCLDPMHEVLHLAVTDCLIEYKGEARNLTDEVDKIHMKCHEIKDHGAAHASGNASHGEGSHHDAGSNGSAVDSPAGSVPAPAPSSASKLAVAAVAGCAMIASLVL
ncbi:hypothetical protein Poli38472_009294 [Pythium oligandrum]|uniref:Elicitin n=1 Tax=Pythium oligandrum TaxID=41045 RepID=A0A8K1CML5_PYTOL|nr:hypothetical protein Poli38472_009294 [Pythium oligandrum]|eukprot:TMW65127.1 hypothetical protein Poli38472_009294 [Pythium oligandrum]